MHAQESSIASVSSIMEFLYANEPALFRETATGLVKLILVMLATNALSEKWLTSTCFMDTPLIPTLSMAPSDKIDKIR